MVTKRTTKTQTPIESGPAADVDGSQPGPASQPAPEGLRVELVDPATLLVDTNVRLDARVDADFTASIATLGVLVPIVAVRTPDGALRVRFGHRRTAAAVQAGLPAVPVVVAGDETAGDAGQIERLVSQYAENEHRTGLTVSERVQTIAQLAAFGVSAAQIAKRTRLPKAQVTAALTVAGNELARAATARYEFLDLLQASVVAEFAADDDTAAVTALVAAAKTGQFDHVAQRLRDQRDERRAKTAAEDTLREQGVTVIDRPEYGAKATRLGNLTDDPATRTPLTVESHGGCPGHAAYVSETWVDDDPTGQRRPTDTEQADQIEDDVEENTEADDQDDEDVEDGDEEAGYWAWLPVWVCTDPVRNGHQPVYAGLGREAKKATADMTEEEREAARAERRDVIESNRAFESATKVRVDWLQTFAARKTPPKGTAAFLAAAIAHDGHLLGDVDANHTAATWLGHTPPPYGRCTTPTDTASTATDGRALVIALVQVLAAYETRMDRDAWRHHRPDVARYLTFLASAGYTLSDVEERARIRA